MHQVDTEGDNRPTRLFDPLNLSHVSAVDGEWEGPRPDGHRESNDQSPPQRKNTSMYVAAWDSSSDDVLSRYLDDIRYFNLLSSDEENALCRRMMTLRQRVSRAVLRAPTAIPALNRLVQQIEAREVSLYQVVRQGELPAPESEGADAQRGERSIGAEAKAEQVRDELSQLRQRVSHLRQAGEGVTSQSRARSGAGRSARYAWLDLWAGWQRASEALRLQPYSYEVLGKALESGEGVSPDDPQLVASRRVWRRVQSHLAQAQSQMVYANLRLVIYVATRFKDRGVPLLDLIQEGNLGLMRAIDKFDPDRGVKFVTYAHWWVRQAISRALADQSRTVRIPSYMIDRKNKLRTETARLWDTLCRPPQVEELSQVLGWTRQEVEALQMVAQPMVWLQTPVTDDGHVLEEVLEDRHGPHPGAQLDAEQLQHCLTECLGGLPERQLFILRLRYGLETGETHSLQQIASMMGLSRERVRQLEKAAFATLRKSSYGSVLADFISVP